MKFKSNQLKRERGSALMGYLVIGLVVVATLTTFASYVIKMIHLSQRRQEMALAYQFAQGGAAVASREVKIAFTNSGPLGENLQINPAGGYVKAPTVSGSTEAIYTRTIDSLFKDQSVQVQIHMDDVPRPTRVRVMALAQVGGARELVESFLQLEFGYAAAIVSTHPGTMTTSASKGGAKQGNVVIAGNGAAGTVVAGGVMANGMCNTNKASVDRVEVLQYGTAEELPDYTDPGSDHQLFDFTRFTAVADATGNHFTSLADFVAAASTGATLEGVLVVDIGKGEKLDKGELPHGINVRGTLVFKFDSSWSPTDKLVNQVALNINAADLSGLDPSDPGTFTTGYPPVYADPSKDPVNVDISGKGFANFTREDDLPALMYNNAIFDVHGPVNISGVVYSPVFMEIENKQKDQIQYIRGAVIGGGGIFIENGSGGTTVIGYDDKSLDLLATEMQRGKSIKLVFQR